MFRTGLRTPAIFSPCHSRFPLHPWLSRRFRYCSSTATTPSSSEYIINEYLTQYVTKETCQHLIPGSVQRHTTVLPYGMVGRQRARAAIGNHFETLAKGTSRVQFPLFLVISTPRQGKTLFLDTIANDPKIIAKWKNPFLRRPDLRREHCLVFNVTFNSDWNLTNTCRQGEISVEAGVYQIALRLIAAAANITTPDSEIGQDDAYEKLQQMLERVICCPNPWTLSQITAVLRKHVLAQLNLNKNQVRWLFLFDEFTKLGDRVSDVVRSGQENSPRQELYSSVSSMINRNRCVIISGFNRRQVKVSASGRGLQDCELPRLNTAATRRSALVLSTRYFQLVLAMATSTRAVYYYELIKSSPGMIGAVIEETFAKSTDGTRAIDDIIGGLTVIDLLKTSKPLIESVLQWKAVQFVASNSGSSAFATNERCGLSENSGTRLSSALMTDSALDGLANFFHMPAGWPTLSPPNISSSLCNVSVEPIFLANTVHGGFFELFLCSLQNYDDALVNLSWGNRDTALAFVRGHFLRDKYQDQDDESQMELFDKEFEHGNTKGLHKLAGYFFEDAVALGICYQKALRSDLSRRLQQLPSASSPLRYFFDNGVNRDRNIDPKFRQVFTNSRAPPSILWLGPSVCTMPAPKLFHFDGQYPRKFNQQEIVIAKQAVSTPQEDFTAVEEEKIYQCFTPQHVLRPARPESNPLADIIFHETIADSNRLVQFWVDTKHSHERHGNIINDVDHPEKFVRNVIYALNNRLLRSKECRVDQIVHIIISTVAEKDVETRINELFSAKDVFRPKYNDERLRANLPTYTLVVVHPESYAFQNLVSQPIANSIPLLDQQLNNSWCQKLGATQDFFRYRATTNHCLDKIILNEQDFAEWRNNRLNDELISSIASCTANIDALVDNILKAACTLKRWPNIGRIDEQDVQYCLMKISQLPMGLILEQLNIVVASDPNLAFATLIPVFSQFGVSIPPRSSAPNETSKPTVSVSIQLPKSGEAEATLDLANAHFFQFLVSHCVIIGELLDGNEIVNDFDDDHRGPWRIFFEDGFMDLWKQHLGEMKAQNIEWKQEVETVSTFGRAEIAGTIWNAHVGHWLEVSSAVSDRHHESVLCCRILRQMTSGSEDVKMFVNSIDSLIEHKIMKKKLSKLTL